ncbi:MAG: ABC-F family ATP-binding cassette domain-containing protein [Actinomycetes bacterium]
MHVLSASGLSKTHDGRTLFADVSLGLTTSDRVGVVGPNGSGKTTLLRILAGAEEPDEGEVITATGARIAYLPQDPALPDLPALDAVDEATDHTVPRHEAEAMLARLGVPLDLPTSAMSGGQRRRVALTITLLPPADLLVLDEPTNHLDVETIAWLEDTLRSRACGLLVVTHDREMLERLVERMLEIDPLGDRRSGRGSVYWHEGSYSDLLEARAERVRQSGAMEARRQNLLRKEIAWLRRGPKARTSKPRFRVEQAQALQAATPEGERGQLQLGTGRRRLGSDVITVEGASAGYDGVPVVRDVDLLVGPGDRIGIVGPNGAGKTTLLRLLTGQLAPLSGTVKHGTTVELGVYEQEARVAPVERSVLDTILDVGDRIPLANGDTLTAEKLAERFGFDGRLQRASTAKLSGGERRRLALLHLLVQAPNVLVLDEPTNDLDLDTLARLEDHLDGFSGTLLVASHDRFVLDRLTDHLLALAPDGTVERHLDWNAYREVAERRRRAQETTDAAARRAPSASAEDNRRRQARMKELRSVEARVEKLGGMREELHAALATAATDHARLAKLTEALRAVESELEAAEERWLELSVD